MVEPAKFETSNFKISPKEPVAGKMFTASIDIKNVGELKGTYTVSWEVEGDESKKEEVTLDPGETQTVTFSKVWSEAGTYNVNISGTSRTLSVLAPAKFEVRNLDIIPNEIVKGENAEVKVKIANIGDVKGTHSITLEIGGEPYSRKELTLNSGEVKTLSFDVTKQEEGKYDLSIGDLSRTLTVVSPAKFEVSNLRITPSEAQTGVETFETVTYDDFSNSQLTDSLSLAERATHEVINGRINFTDATPHSHGTVVDSSFDRSWRNWKWEGNVITGTGRITLLFYSDLGWLDGQEGGSYSVQFRQFEDRIVIGTPSGVQSFVNYNFRSGEQHKFKITYGEGDIEVFIDGKKKLSYTISSPNYTNGGFSIRAFSGPSPDPKYLLDYRLSRIKTGVEPGDPIDISADVTNTGGLSGNYTVNLKINGIVKDSKTVTLDSGETTTVSFTVQREKSGTYSVGLGGLTSSFEVL